MADGGQFDMAGGGLFAWIFHLHNKKGHITIVQDVVICFQTFD